MSRIVPIKNHKGYSISEDGKVLGDFGRLLKPRIRKSTGYYSVVLYRPKKSYLVHRLVALHFIPNPENKPQVNHKDGDKSNNHYINLEWVTNSENQKHSYDIGTHTPNMGLSSLCIGLKRYKKKREEKFKSYNEAIRKTGYSRSLIKKFINQSRKDPENFSWCKI